MNTDTAAVASTRPPPGFGPIPGPMGDSNPPVVSLDDEAYEPPTYDEVFPPLATAVGAANDQSSEGVPGAMLPRTSYARMAVKSSTITQVFYVPLEERRYKEMNQGFGESDSQSSRICAEIMKSTGASIEMSLAKDQSLTIVVTGKPLSVMAARREVLNRLQTQANISIPIPKEHHRFIIGKGGSKMKELENITATKINIPTPNDTSDLIHIVGPKEGIERARHEIQLISEEQAKLAFERLSIPRVYHPFIEGPDKNYIKEIKAKTGAKIHVPPPSALTDEIVVSGEKEGVKEAIDWINATYNEKKLKTTTVSLEVRKCQHKYVIGPRGSNITEILEKTGVSVEMPSLDTVSETITLRGEQSQLGQAITMVYDKANSVVISEVGAPAWLHRFIIGRQGKNIRSITQNLSNVHVEFEEGRDKITLEGPPQQVEEARRALEEISRDLQSRLDFAIVKIDPKFHKHIIGKGGANVNRIKKETGVSIRIPADNEKSNEIRIEGSPEGVRQAKTELMEMATRMENEKSRDILIEHRFHRSIIGTKGENIRDIRDKYNQVQITFPDSGMKSDVVTLRGPKQDVDKCYKFLQQLALELVTNNYMTSVPIFKKFHKNIIGKGGSTINKIKEDTETRIEIPTESSDSDVIQITGKKKNVEKAKSQIIAIQNELANITETEVSIPAKFHQSLIGAKGRLVRAIMDECGGVHIHFPSEGSKSDKVTIRGPKEEVDKAKEKLTELANEKEQANHSIEVHAKPEYHKFLIGRGGANIRQVREETGARVVFPTSRDEDKTLITIIGTKENTGKAKDKLLELIKDLENITECEITVDPKYHRHFVARRGQVLREIADENGNVTVSFPRNGSKSDKVMVKGAKNCVEAATARIAEIVADLEAQVTIECIIPQKHHRTIMGAKGSRVQLVTSQFEVGIKFPDRNPNAEQAEEGELVVNGDSNGDAHEEDKPKKCDTILITGKKENCEQAKEALEKLVPVTEEVDVPFDFHRFVIGQKGAGIKHLMDTYEVNIAIPPAMHKSNQVKVSGPAPNVQNAVQALKVRVEELHLSEEDRRLQNFSEEVAVDMKYHPKIIGRKGQIITKIKEEHKVKNIQFADRNAANPNIITIIGYEKNVQAAKEAILDIVHNLEDQHTVEMEIDHRIHSRLIGAKGRAINKVMELYKVDIRFPRSTDANPNLVTITGLDENIDEVQEYLLNRQEEYLQEMDETVELQQYTKPPSRHHEDQQPKADNPGFVVRGAPWNKPPDTSNTMDFPSIGVAENPRPSVVTGSSSTWGPWSKR